MQARPHNSSCPLKIFISASLVPERQALTLADGDLSAALSAVCFLKKRQQ